MSSRRGLSVFALVGLCVAACQPDGGDTADAEAAAEAEAQPQQTASTPPDTTGAAIWSHLQDEDYQANWALWPGRSELYPGAEPHGMLLTMYVNDVAMNALNQGAAAMPNGAIVVKENYMPDSTLAAVTTMYKRTGYNADHADWFFTKHLADGSLDQTPDGMAMEGRLQGCQSCHMARADNDYLFAEVQP